MMKHRQINYNSTIIICFCSFVLGWILGTSLLLVFLSLSDNQFSFVNLTNNLEKTNLRARVNNKYTKIHHDPQELTSNLIDSLVLDQLNDLHRVTKTNIPEKSQSIDYKQVLPRFSEDISNSSSGQDDEQEDRTFIFLDWSLHDELFTIENYKVLESMLHVYPSAYFRVILMIPSYQNPISGDITNLKLKTSLSTRQFIKYKKLNYDIEVVTVGKMNKGYLSQIGKDYWQTWMLRCCHQTLITEESHLLPYHVLNYVRLHRLWRRGGIFTDFSFFFLGPISKDAVKQGYYMNSNCFASSSKISNETLCATSTLLVFNEPKSDVILCALKSYEDQSFLSCLDEDTLLGGASCVQNVFNECFVKSGLSNDLAVSDDSILEVFGGEVNNAALTIMSTDWSIANHKRIFWMGSLAYSNQWTILPYPDGTMLQQAVSSLSLNQLSSLTTCESISTNCSHYAPPFNSSFLNMETNDLSINRASEVNYWKHSLGVSSCVPSIVIPGFDSHYALLLARAILDHPQVLPSLTGYQAGCYHPSNFDSRMHCFPYLTVEENMFTTLDISTSYALDETIPEKFQLDNPTTKMIFIVEHPADRLYASYISGVADGKINVSFSEIVTRGLSQESKFSHLRRMVTNGTEIETILQYYYSKNQVVDDLQDLFLQSITFPAILHYQRKLGTGNVMVVLSEAFETSWKFHETMNTIWNFLDLCPHETSMPIKTKLPHSLMFPNKSLPISISSLGWANTDFSDQPTSYPTSFPINRNVYSSLEYETYSLVNKFFVPFNDVFMKMTGLNTSSWNYRTKPSYFGSNEFLATADEMDDVINTTTVLSWFEIEDNNRNDHLHKRSLEYMWAHLFPKRKARQDESYNTTLGLLISF